MLSDRAVARLRAAMDEPDFSGTRYRLVGWIGQGGMGSVYEAEDTLLGRRVAVKIVRLPEPERLLEEARRLAGLEHPGIVPVHDAGTLPDGRMYYAMKRAAGETLDRARLGSSAERLRLYLRVCEAVGFAHARGVLHLDLKPQNLMLGAFGEVLVLDWGAAQLAGAPEGRVAGTRGFMAPEQESGRPEPRSDVFALGRILAGLIESPPKRLRAIADRASAATPEARYASVEALAADVSRYLEGEPVEAYREKPWERLARWSARHHTVLLLLVVYLAVRAILFMWLKR